VWSRIVAVSYEGRLRFAVLAVAVRLRHRPPLGLYARRLLLR
jgi:hypothetical protein